VLIRFLGSLGYEVTRQRGSHVRLVKVTQQAGTKLRSRITILLLRELWLIF
jgi:predicted RNA binding protein YcfA (HicA-like mRNA interferase family)